MNSNFNNPSTGADDPGPVTHFNQTELARRWRVSGRSLERWRWLGQGPWFLKIGGRVVYRRADVEEYERQQIRDSTATAPTK